MSILQTLGLSPQILNGRGHPCPKCGGRDRFAAFPDVARRGAVHCRKCFTRGCDPAPGTGLATIRWFIGGDWGDASGWLNDYFVGGTTAIRSLRTARCSTATIANTSTVGQQASGASKEFETVRDRHARDVRNMRQGWWKRLSQRLRLCEASLQAIQAAWSPEENAIGIPMRNADRDVVGIRYRSLSDGSKWSAKASRAGLFWPIDLMPKCDDRLLLTEGPTDAAALHGLGFSVLGLPSAHGGRQVLLRAVERLRPTEIIIVGDGDVTGRRAARQLMRQLAGAGWRLRMLFPPEPFKDVREWVASTEAGRPVVAGAIRRDIDLAIAEAPEIRERSLFDDFAEGLAD